MNVASCLFVLCMSWVTSAAKVEFAEGPQVARRGEKVSISFALSQATDVEVVDANTIICQVDPDGAEPGMWGLLVTPERGEIAKYSPDDGLQMFACDADLNADSRVDLFDFAELAGNWRRDCSAPDWCGGADVDRSGRVDLDDLAILAQQWLAGAAP